MALSGSIEKIYTAQEVVDRALRRIGVLGAGQSASGDEFTDAAGLLNDMLKTWSMVGPNLWTLAEASVTLVSGTQEYTLSPRPRSVENMRIAVDGVERLPLSPWSRNDWDRFPMKTDTGQPIKYMIDRQRTETKVKFWPIPTFSGEVWTVPYSYERVWQDVTLPAHDIDVPQEWFETVIYCLAARCADEWQIESPTSQRVRERAKELYDLAMTFDRDGDVRIEVVR